MQTCVNNYKCLESRPSNVGRKYKKAGQNASLLTTKEYRSVTFADSGCIMTCLFGLIYPKILQGVGLEFVRFVL